MQFLLFASIFLLAMALMNVYIWRRFLRLISHAKVHYLIIIPILLMVGDAFFILDVATGVIPDSPALYYISSSFVGVTFMLFVVAVIYDLSITVSKRVPVDQSRRRMLKLVFDVTMLVAAFAYLLRGFSQGVQFPGLNRVQVKIKDFPLERFNLVQLTDIHVGRTIKRGFVERLVADTNALNPDMVVITGDLIELPLSHIEYDLYPLKDLNAPTYFILGNHAYFHGIGEALAYIKELGIIPSFFGMHTYYWGDWHRDSVLGPERAARISPAASALKRGMIHTQHHDAPVALPSAIMILASQVNRTTRSGQVLGAEQRVSVMAALKTITIAAAYQYFEENTKGSLEPGKLADFVILDKNPLKVESVSIKDIKVVETIKEGDVIYRAPGR